jgi:hypothetical protein
MIHRHAMRRCQQKLEKLLHVPDMKVMGTGTCKATKMTSTGTFKVRVPGTQKAPHATRDASVDTGIASHTRIVDTTNTAALTRPPNKAGQLLPMNTLYILHHHQPPLCLC